MHFTDEDATHETLFPNPARLMEQVGAAINTGNAAANAATGGTTRRTIECAMCLGRGEITCEHTGAQIPCANCDGTGRIVVYGTPSLPSPSPAPVQQSLITQTQHLIPEEVDKTLAYILSLKRPYDSKTEIEFMGWLRGELMQRGVPKNKIEIRKLGCVAAHVRRPDGKDSTTLFSCHTDTVHGDDGKQQIVYDSNFGHIFLDTGKDAPKSNCLGADDGIGVWIMLEMIKAKVPGTYVFHRGEERGGLGSQEMAAKDKLFLQKFDAAVAFDRPCTDEVITHQRGQRCASDKYAAALAERLNVFGLEYKPSDRGVFTDTANYRKLIHECINLGVGYENQHGTQEFQDYAHAVALRDACIKVDWESLPIDRDCTKDDYTAMGGGHYGSHGSHGANAFNNFLDHKYGRDWRDGHNHGGGKKKHNKKPTAGEKLRGGSPDINDPVLDSVAEVEGLKTQEVIDFVEGNAEEAAILILDLASEVAALREKIKFLRGAL
ncbi:MAG: M28 family peptidase [Betaproteobacteria bacterium]